MLLQVRFALNLCSICAQFMLTFAHFMLTLCSIMLTFADFLLIFPGISLVSGLIVGGTWPQLIFIVFAIRQRKPYVHCCEFRLKWPHF